MKTRENKAQIGQKIVTILTEYSSLVVQGLEKQMLY